MCVAALALATSSSIPWAVLLRQLPAEVTVELARVLEASAFATDRWYGPAHSEQDARKQELVISSCRLTDADLRACHALLVKVRHLILQVGGGTAQRRWKKLLSNQPHGNVLHVRERVPIDRWLREDDIRHLL